MTPKTPNQRLVDFMELKSELLNAKGVLFTPEDADDLLSWPVEKAENVAEGILRAFGNYEIVYDILLCPWCVFHAGACSSCTFALRHGRCPSTDEESQGGTYAKVLQIIPARSFTAHLKPYKDQLLATLKNSTGE